MDLMRSSRLAAALFACVCALCSSLAGAPSASAGAPMIEDEWVSSLGYTTATLAAKINPSEEATKYRFEYGTSVSYGASVPAVETAIGALSEGQIVREMVSGLTPGASYHYRVVASNASETVYGVDKVLRPFAVSVEGTDTCANASIRQIQASSDLSDCRAYEMVSPVEKGAVNVAAGVGMTQSSVNGDAVKYHAGRAFLGDTATQQDGAEYVGQRGSTGWSSHEINPPQSSVGGFSFSSAAYEMLSPDLSKGVYFAYTPVIAGHPDVEDVFNLYLRNDILTSTVGSYELLSECTLCGSTPLPKREMPSFSFAGFYMGIAFAGASEDWSHIFYESINDLTPETAGLSEETPKLYEWDNGALRLVGVLPNGQAAEGSVAGAGAGGTMGNEGAGTWSDRAISRDGSRVVFTADAAGNGINQQGWNVEKGYPSEGNIYLRIDGRETVQLNVSERATPDPLGYKPATFWAATPDGSKIFFSSAERLTDDATGENAQNIYLYDTNAPAGKHLRLISVDENQSNENRGVAVVGVSTDGSYVYFLGETSLLREQTEVVKEPGGEAASALYVWHDGAIRYITSHETLGFAVSGTYWGEQGRAGFNNFRVTPDGRTALLTSRDEQGLARLGIDVRTVPGGACLNENTCDQVLVYKYESDRLMCASCDPMGRPVSDAGFSNLPDLDSNYTIEPERSAVRHNLPNALSQDGRYVFFDTADALVPNDINGHRDVYEYDTTSGQTHLISSGTCGCDSVFVDASPDATNVFFTTPQTLVRIDRDNANDLYDARVGGGIQAQNEAPPEPCEGDDCQGPAKGASAFSLPSSATFAGIGNPPADGRAGAKAKARLLSGAQKRARALALCRRRWKGSPHRRAACETRARRRHRGRGSAAAKSSGTAGRWGAGR
jgi:hypothetical protein